MIAYTHNYTVDLDSGTLETRWDTPLTYGDKNADKIQVTLMRGSAPATVSGLTAMLYGVLSNGSTAFRAGSTVGNVVTADMDETFYAIPGKIDLLLQLSEGATVRDTPLRITAYVKFGPTDEMVSTGEQFSLAELEAIAAACEAATEAANTATSAANASASTANTAAANADIATGNAQDAADAITGITAEAEAVAYGSPPTAVAETDPIDGHINLALGLPTGPTGVRGTITYSGTAITGTSTTPTAYATGIDAAIAGDRYQYNGTVDAQRGNVYKCTLGGDAATALWIYDGNIRGEAGTGSVNTVDGISADVDGDVALAALRLMTATDANALTTPGIHLLASSAAHVPGAGSNWIIMHTPYDASNAAQEAMAVSASALRYYRQKVSGTWGSWQAIKALLGLDTLEAVNGIIKCNGSGGYSAAGPNTDYLKPRVELWSGSWSSGNITVPNIGNYSEIEIELTSLYVIRGIVTGSILRAGGIYGISTDSTILLYLLSASVSGTTLTMQHCTRYSMTQTPTVTPASDTVTKIYGVNR